MRMNSKERFSFIYEAIPICSLLLLSLNSIDGRPSYSIIDQKTTDFLSRKYTSNFISIKQRSKRNAADSTITDSHSRLRQRHLRQAVLFKLLTAVESGSGRNCACVLEEQTSSSEKCLCNAVNIFGTIVQQLASDETNQKSRNQALKKILAKISPDTRAQVRHLALYEMKRALRAMAIEKHILKRLRHRAMHRRNLIRQFPRAAFDGKQLMSF